MGGNCRYSQVVEVASNDGYLLQYFPKKGISVLGIEPAANTAAVAILKPDGILMMELPHLLQLIEQNQFDTIYYEHWQEFMAQMAFIHDWGGQFIVPIPEVKYA